jgi:hypothetical protein
MFFPYECFVGSQAETLEFGSLFNEYHRVPAMSIFLLLDLSLNITKLYGLRLMSVTQEFRRLPFYPCMVSRNTEWMHPVTPNGECRSTRELIR